MFILEVCDNVNVSCECDFSSVCVCESMPSVGNSLCNLHVMNRAADWPRPFGGCVQDVDDEDECGTQMETCCNQKTIFQSGDTRETLKE